MAKIKTPAPSVVHHRVRTTIAAVCGFIAMTLVSVSILVVWANRTLTDTPTFVAAVGPVIERPELQQYLADRATEQLVTSAPLEDLAEQLLSPAQAAGKSPEELQSLLRPVIHDSILSVVKAPRMADAWKQTLTSNHAEVVRQLDADSGKVTLDLSQMVRAVLDEMKSTKLAPVADKLDLKPQTAKVDIKGIEKVHQAYSGLKAAPLVVLALTLLFASLSVWISVHHMKTLRRMLVGTGVSALVTAGVIALLPVVHIPTSDPEGGKLAGALGATLLHGLQVGCLVLGAATLAAALGSKLYERSLHKS
jgi:hypothetical protein